MIVLGACAVWSLATAAATDGRPEGMLLAVLAVAAGYAGGRIGGALLPVALPAAGALAGLGLVVLSPHAAQVPDGLSPLGDTAGRAGVLALATGAACCAAWAAVRPATRLVLRLLAAATAVTAAVLGASAGFVACAGVLLCSLAAERMRHRALGLAGLAVVTAGSAGVTWAVAVDALPDGLTAALEGQLTGHRVLLWRDAVGMAADHPALGAGPGRFGELSPTVTQSLPPDGRPHSALLQQAAEQGLLGAGLLGAGFCWVLYALWRSPRSTPVTLTAGAALTALAVISMVGNALSFTTVTAAAGLLAGLATARPLGYELSGEGEGQNVPASRLP